MIRFSKYVRITSGVGGSSNVRQRDLIGRLLTQSDKMSPGEVLEFADAAAVAAHFGAASPEALRAGLYFGYVSPAISSPRRLSFGRFAPEGAYPRVFGAKLSDSLATLKTIVAGVITLNLDGVEVDVTGLDFSAAAAFADIATALQVAIRATADPMLTAATVNYDAPSNAFTLVAGGTAEFADITFGVTQSGAGLTDAASHLKWYAAEGAIVTNGAAVQTPLAAFNETVAISNNFGSFSFLPAPQGGAYPAIEDLAAVAAANAALNVAFHMSIPVTQADAVSWSAALIGYAGCSLTLSPIAAEYPELVPMAQLAATDYTQRNATVNYMFKQFPVTPAVDSDALSDSMDAIRVNYYGRTQNAGVALDFYQRGVMMGPATAPVDMNVYANEQWLKDAAATSIMDLLVSASRVPANESGRGMILAVLQDVIDRALTNGTISTGKSLTAEQKLFVTQRSGDPLAWHQVQDSGYWLDVTIVPFVNTAGLTEYKSVYALLYSKDDAIRSVEGSHVLI